MIAFKSVNLLFFAGFLTITYLLFKSRLKGFPLLAFISTIALNPWFIIYNNMIMSDIPFLFFAMLALYLIDQLSVQRTFLATRWAIYNAAIGIVIFLACFIREHGLLLLSAAASIHIVQLLGARKDPDRSILRIGMLCAMPYIVFLGLILISGAFIKNSSVPRVQELSLITAKTIIGNLEHYLVVPSSFFAGTRYTRIVYGLFLPFLIVGLVRDHYAKVHWITFSIATFGLYILWPYQAGVRFLLPLMPLYAYFVIRGLVITGQMLQEPHRLRFGWSWALVAVAILLLFVRSTVAHSIKYRGLAKHEGPYHRDSTTLFEFISDSTPPDAMFVFFKPRVMRLYTDRDTIKVDRQNSAAVADYVVIYRRTTTGLKYDVNAMTASGTWQISFKNNTFFVLKNTRNNNERRKDK